MADRSFLMGASKVFNGSECDLTKGQKHRTDGAGVDIAIDIAAAKMIYPQLKRLCIRRLFFYYEKGNPNG